MDAEETLSVAEATTMIGKFSDIFGDYGGQKLLAARFMTAEAMIDDINGIDFGEDRLMVRFNHNQVFTRSSVEAVGDVYRPFCTAYIGRGMRFLGDKLLRMTIDAGTSDQYPEELLLVDSQAGVGVNIRHNLEVATAEAIKRFGYAERHAEFLKAVHENTSGHHIYWDNSPL